MSGKALWSGFGHVQSDGLDGLLGDGQGDGIPHFPLREGEFLFLEGNMIQGDPADLHAPKAQRVSQVHHGSCSDLSWGCEIHRGKEFLDLLWS